jgi:hypothetical protein
MDYTVKPGTDGFTGPPFTCMSQRIRADDRIEAAESKFYLPAGGVLSSAAGRLERLWTRVFNHGIETSR